MAHLSVKILSGAQHAAGEINQDQEAEGEEETGGEGASDHEGHLWLTE